MPDPSDHEHAALPHPHEHPVDILRAEHLLRGSLPPMLAMIPLISGGSAKAA
jgi:hypothetical protein